MSGHGEFDKETLRKTRKFLEAFERKGAHLPFAFTNPISLNPRIREESINEIIEGIEVTAELELDYVVTHARGTTFGLIPPEEEWSLFKQVLFTFGDLCESRGIVFTVENGDFLHSLDRLAYMMKDLDLPGVGITLDTGHAYLSHQGEQGFSKCGSIRSFIREEGQLIRNVHLHDCDGKRDHLPLGEGIVDFEGIIDELKAHKYEGSLNLEFPATEKEIRQSLRYLQKLIQGASESCG